MFGDLKQFQVFLGFVVLMGLVVVVVSFGAVFVILTGGVGDGDVAAFPEGFQCQEFNGDPDVGHESAYGITVNTTLSALDAINGGSTDEGFELSFNVSDPSVLNVSARRADGTAVPVTVQNRTVRVASNSTAPFRLWIDTARSGTITRSELDICPPAANSG